MRRLKTLPFPPAGGEGLLLCPLPTCRLHFPAKQTRATASMPIATDSLGRVLAHETGVKPRVRTRPGLFVRSGNQFSIGLSVRAFDRRCVVMESDITDIIADLVRRATPQLESRLEY